MWLLSVSFLVCLSLPHINTDVLRWQPSCPCSDPDLCKPVSKHYDQEIFAFATTAANWKKYPWDSDLLTTLAITYANSPSFDPQLICHAHQRNVRVVALVDFPKSQLLNDTARSTWVKQMLQMAKDKFLDGVNLDFEETISIFEIAEKDALSALTMELYSAFKAWSNDSQITFDTPSDAEGSGRHFDYVALAAATDFLFMMDYDESGSRNAYANCDFEATSQGVKNFEALGIPPQKLVMGVPWYGYQYPCSSIEPGSNRCTIKPPYGSQVGYAGIMSMLKKSTSGRMFDDKSLSPFFNLGTSESGDLLQVWYDDPESLSYKYVYARGAMLRGIGMWTADEIDYTDPVQTQQMWNAMKKYKPVS